MAGAGKKTFTAGEVLTASDVNTYLMEQSVMVFGGTAARSSAIPTPSTGMTSYIGVTGTASIPQIETYTGSAWQTPYGLTQVANVSFSNVSTIAIDNVFTSAYANYRLVIEATSNSSADNTPLFMQMRKAGVTLGGTAYRNGAFFQAFPGSTGNFFSQTGGATWAVVQYGRAGYPSYCSMDLYNPQVATKYTSNTFLSFCAYSTTGEVALFGASSHVVNDSYDGMLLSSGAGNVTGIVRIYGYRNS